jgi:hypothetical protein
METLDVPFAEAVAETAHWGDNPPDRIEEQEFDLLAFDLWHLGRSPDLTELEEWEWVNAPGTVGSRASCL